MDIIATAKPSIEMLHTMNGIGLVIVGALSLGLMLSIMLATKSKTKK